MTYQTPAQDLPLARCPGPLPGTPSHFFCSILPRKRDGGVWGAVCLSRSSCTCRQAGLQGAGLFPTAASMLGSLLWSGPVAATLLRAEQRESLCSPLRSPSWSSQSLRERLRRCTEVWSPPEAPEPLLSESRLLAVSLLLPRALLHHGLACEHSEFIFSLDLDKCCALLAVLCLCVLSSRVNLLSLSSLTARCDGVSWRGAL